MEDNNILGVDLSYNGIDQVEVVFDEADNVVEPQNNGVSPFDVIKATAEAIGQTINEPKSGCKHCSGRGYIGRDGTTQAPIPCQCIYPKENKSKNDYMYNRTKHMSRAERRQWERQLKREMKKEAKKSRSSN